MSSILRNRASTGWTLFLTLYFIFRCSLACVLTIANDCPYTVWPAISTHHGSPFQPGANLTDTHLQSGDFIMLHLTPGWSGSVYGQTSCNECGGYVTCLTGQNGPRTTAKFHLGTDGQDLYEISIESGFNLRMTLDAGVKCPATHCNTDINSICPHEDLKIYNSQDIVIGCKSACSAYGGDNNCCNSSNCPASEVGFYTEFKSACPQASVYPMDGDPNEHGDACPAYTPTRQSCQQSEVSSFTIFFCPGGGYWCADI